MQRWQTVCLRTLHQHRRLFPLSVLHRIQTHAGGQPLWRQGYQPDLWFRTLAADHALTLVHSHFPLSFSTQILMSVRGRRTVRKVVVSTGWAPMSVSVPKATHWWEAGDAKVSHKVTSHCKPSIFCLKLDYMFQLHFFLLIFPLYFLDNVYLLNIWSYISFVFVLYICLHITAVIWPMGTIKTWSPWKSLSLSPNCLFSLPDIDECAVNRRLCQPFGTCENTQGSFECVCNHGYVQSEDKRSCEGRPALIFSN